MNRKPREHTPKIRLEDEIESTISGEREEPTELPKLPAYRRNGFKRVLSGAILLIGGALSLIPQTSAIGQGVLILGGVTGITGMGDALKKNRQKEEITYVDNNKWLALLADFIIYIVNKLWTKKKN